MIELVTLDFWNTIFDSSNGTERNKYRQRALIVELDKHGRMLNQEEFEDAMKRSWDFFNGIWFNEKRTPEPRETVEFFWNYLNIDKDEEAINRIVEEFAISTVKFPPKLNEGAYEAILELKKKFKIALVSDTGFTSGVLLRKILDRFNILPFFDSLSFSDETGVSKPHPNAFMKVLNELNCKPENSIHIGDIEKTDIEGAKSLGMYAIRYSGDKTASLAKQNPKKTKADAEIASWSEIPLFIDNLNKK
jgi:HAD superfamily hydrolase (TIGR01509 family)